MRRFLKFFARLSALLLGLSLCLSPLRGFAAYNFEYERAVGNPLKGFMPFYSPDGADDSVPYSMEWFYIPLSALISDSGEYTVREGLEPYLEAISARGNQAVFRVYLDYPGSDIGEKAVPRFIWDMGIKKERYDEYGGGFCPDYSDGRLIDILCDFVRELAREYDGDRRIAYITTGLLGHWGEWHVCLPELEATNEQKAKIISAFAQSFKVTRILTRYPGTPGTTRKGNVGFHDDSFTHSTLYDESWHFMAKMKKARQTGVWKISRSAASFARRVRRRFCRACRSTAIRTTPSASTRLTARGLWRTGRSRVSSTQARLSAPRLHRRLSAMILR